MYTNRHLIFRTMEDAVPTKDLRTITHINEKMGSHKGFSLWRIHTHICTILGSLNGFHFDIYTQTHTPSSGQWRTAFRWRTCTQIHTHMYNFGISKRNFTLTCVHKHTWHIFTNTRLLFRAVEHGVPTKKSHTNTHTIRKIMGSQKGISLWHIFTNTFDICTQTHTSSFGQWRTAFRWRTSSPQKCPPPPTICWGGHRRGRHFEVLLTKCEGSCSDRRGDGVPPFKGKVMIVCVCGSVGGWVCACACACVCLSLSLSLKMGWLQGVGSLKL